MSEQNETRPRRLALIASKGSLDMAYPPLILGTTAASMGWEVGIFYTFYGLDIVHKERQKKLAVSPLGNPAMPPPISAVPLKVPAMVGMLPGMTAAATSIMKGWMDRANLAPLDELFQIAMDLGVKMYACNTTMKVMGVHPEDIIAGVDFAGSPAFLDFAADADVQLFI
jgi:peroxiredoxin family protein